jgi:hypothetical protein
MKKRLDHRLGAFFYVNYKCKHFCKQEIKKMNDLLETILNLSQEDAFKLLDAWWKKDQDTLAHWWVISPIPQGINDEPGGGHHEKTS